MIMLDLNNIGVIMRDLITNVAILVAYVSLFNQIIKSYDFTPKSSKKKRFTLGIATGLLGCLFMIFNVEILSGVMFDCKCLTPGRIDKKYPRVDDFHQALGF